MTTVVDKSNVHEVNLAVLKRVDPEVEQVLGSAAHVCLYTMSLETQTWDRKNVEGSLFLLKRRVNPRFQIVVLNKLATENYYETIHGGFEIEIQPPYLMYTKGDGKIHGIWFYGEADLEAVAGLLGRVKAGLPRPDALPPGVGEQQDVAPAPAAAPAAPAPAQPVQPVPAVPAAGGGEAEEEDGDGGFWDKKVKVDPSQVPLKPGFPGGPPLTTATLAHHNKQEPSPPTPNSATAAASGGGVNALTSLFKNAQLKQQQQAQHTHHAQHHAPHPAAAPATAAPCMPLPPNYFKSAAPPTAPAPAPGTGGENPLERLFSKGGSSCIPMSAVTAALAQQQHPTATTTAASAAPNPLSALFANAAHKAAAAGAAAPPAPAQAQAPPPTQPMTPAQVQAAVRGAVARVVARDAFIDMLVEELKAGGVLAG